MLLRAATLLDFKANAIERDIMSHEISVGGANFGLGRGKFEVASSKAFEESPVVDAGDGVEHGDIVEVDGNAFEVFDEFVYDLDEPTGRSSAALGHKKSFEELGGCAERGEGVDVLVDGDSV